MMQLRELIAVERDEKYIVICGNMRLDALREIGIKTTLVKNGELLITNNTLKKRNIKMTSRYRHKQIANDVLYVYRLSLLNTWKSSAMYSVMIICSQ